MMVHGLLCNYSEKNAYIVYTKWIISSCRAEYRLQYLQSIILTHDKRQYGHCRGENKPIFHENTSAAACLMHCQVPTGLCFPAWPCNYGQWLSHATHKAPGAARSATSAWAYVIASIQTVTRLYGLGLLASCSCTAGIAWHNYAWV